MIKNDFGEPAVLPDLVISFSGGETSAFMTRLLLTKFRPMFGRVVVVFANTGQENEETLEFVRRCDEHFAFGTVWLEAVVDPRHGHGVRHRVVDFASASRNGEPFEAVIAKHGIPNKKFPFCTRELKLRPIESWVKTLALDAGYRVAVGIRADEPKRVHRGGREIYPMADMEPVAKPDVNAFWAAQPFRLELQGYQGNCKWCWKKSTRKLLTILEENPAAFDFPERMESTYGTVGPEFKKPGLPVGYRRVFFRESRSAKDLRFLNLVGDFDLAVDDAVVYPDGTKTLLDDVGSDPCAETCEVNFNDQG